MSFAPVSNNNVQSNQRVVEAQRTQTEAKPTKAADISPQADATRTPATQEVQDDARRVQNAAEQGIQQRIQNALPSDAAGQGTQPGEGRGASEPWLEAGRKKKCGRGGPCMADSGTPRRGLGETQLA